MSARNRRKRLKGSVMKVQIDKDLCIGDNICVAICPELFAMDGKVAKTKMQKVPESLIKLCWDAAKLCPTEAIIIDK
jgi:ferredoxin